MVRNSGHSTPRSTSAFLDGMSARLSDVSGFSSSQAAEASAFTASGFSQDFASPYRARFTGWPAAEAVQLEAAGRSCAKAPRTGTNTAGTNPPRNFRLFILPPMSPPMRTYECRLKKFAEFVKLEAKFFSIG